MAKRAATTSSRGAEAAQPLGTHTRVAIFHGPEGFLRDEYTRQLREALQAAGIEAETFRFDGASAAVADVLDECRSFGLMASHKLVIVDRAEEMLKESEDGTRVGEKSPRKLMESYAAAPAENATLVLRAETWRPGNLDKAVAALGAAGSIIKCEQPDAAKAAGWAVRRCERRHGAKLERAAAVALIQHVGCDMGRIDSELAKLALGAESVPGGVTITEEMVRQQTGLSKEEEFWGMQQLLLEGEAPAALRKLRELLEVSRHTPVAVMVAYLDLARKLHGAALGAQAGENPGATAGRLRLWGPSRDGVLHAARRVSAAAAGEMLREAVEADAQQKSGVGDPVRNLERLTVRIIDRLSGTGDSRRR